MIEFGIEYRKKAWRLFGRIIKNYYKKWSVTQRKNYDSLIVAHLVHMSETCENFKMNFQILYIYILYIIYPTHDWKFKSCFRDAWPTKEINKVSMFYLYVSRRVERKTNIGTKKKRPIGKILTPGEKTIFNKL